MNGFNFNSFGNSKQTISYCEVDKCKEVIKLKESLRKIHKIARAGYEGMCSDCSKKQCEENNCIEHAIFEILVKCGEVLSDR